MRVGSKGCPTLYKSQVVLSIKDTPRVPKLCVNSEHDGILDRSAIIAPTPTDFLEAEGAVHGPGARVGLAHLEVNLARPPLRQGRDDLLNKRAPDPAAARIRRHSDVQNLAFIGGVEGDDVADDTVLRFRNEKQRIGRQAVAEVLRRPRVGKDDLLDRMDRWDVTELSGTNEGGDDRGGPPILPALPRGGRRSARSRRRGCAALSRAPIASATMPQSAARCPGRRATGRSNRESPRRNAAHRRQRRATADRGGAQSVQAREPRRDQARRLSRRDRGRICKPRRTPARAARRSRQRSGRLVRLQQRVPRQAVMARRQAAAPALERAPLLLPTKYADR